MKVLSFFVCLFFFQMCPLKYNEWHRCCVNFISLVRIIRFKLKHLWIISMYIQLYDFVKRRRYRHITHIISWNKTATILSWCEAAGNIWRQWTIITTLSSVQFYSMCVTSLPPFPITPASLPHTLKDCQESSHFWLMKFLSSRQHIK